MSTTQFEEMNREAQSFKDKLDAMRNGASPAHSSIIEKLYAVAESNQSIVRLALDSIKRRTPPVEQTR